MAGTLRHVALPQLRTDPHHPTLLDLIDADSVAHGIALHRIREVRRDGALIWSRAAPVALRRG